MTPVNPNLNASGLLAALHELFLHSLDKSVDLDSLSALVIDNKPPDRLVESCWAHAHKRSEDELVLLSPCHDAAHSLLLGALGSFPNVDSRVMTCVSVVQPFLTAMTSLNLNHRFHNGVSLKLSLNPRGEIMSCRLQLSQQPLLSLEPLTELSSAGSRSFDVFYHMLYSQMDDSDRSEFLLLKKSLSEYDLLAKSGTYELPEWVAFADDYALAKDWIDNVEEIFPKSFQLSMLMALSGVLLLGNSSSEDKADGAALIGLDYEKCREIDPKVLIESTYIAILNSVEAMVNKYLAKLDLPDMGSEEGFIYSVVHLTELPTNQESKQLILKSKFDNNFALNMELEQDGMKLPKPPSNVSKQLSKLEKQAKKNADLLNLGLIDDFGSILDSSATWFRDTDSADFLDVHELIPLSRVWSVFSLAPSASAKGVAIQESWNSAVVSSQIRDFFLTEWIQRGQQLNYTADFDVYEFLETFASILPHGIQPDELSAWAEAHFSPLDFFQGHKRVYLSEPAFVNLMDQSQMATGLSTGTMQGDLAPNVASVVPQQPQIGYAESLIPPSEAGAVPQQVEAELEKYYPASEVSQPTTDERFQDLDSDDEYGDLLRNQKDLERGQHLEVQSQSLSRKTWIWFVWLITWWIPSPLLNFVGKMKRKDVRLAWREKLVIFLLIVLLNCFIIFYMIILGRLICPDYDKVWNHKELSYHQGTNDFYVGIHGNTYDITKFYKLQHSDTDIKTSASNMMPFAGLDLSDYFPPPLTVACPSLVTDESVILSYNTTESPYSQALHRSGSYYVPSTSTVLHNYTWYDKVFTPGIMKYYKGKLVATDKDVKKKVEEDPSKYIIKLRNKFYDVTNYMITIDTYPSSQSQYYEKYNFFPTSVSNLFSDYQGEDITEKFEALDETTKSNAFQCLENAFAYASNDFRQSAKCQTANIILLVIAGLLTSITLIKFLASIRFTTKPMPIAQDKFVLCQIPIYTESEDDMRLAIDSLTNMKYDNRRKLLVLICDGMITGSGNDRPTPEIVLDILGVDMSKVNAEPKPYHAIAEGSKELNYAKVYSGLYENEGDMVPFLCIVKTGIEGETRPGNRGKRDSQLIMMNFLNRVHYANPMCPLDLEIFHHMNNIIGIEPERFEFLLAVDADTKVRPDALNRLVAACTTDNDVSAVCGETGIQNEQDSLSTMVQVYEYFISHHLTKAFESMFGTITCLPGCFSLYRLRTVKKSKPLLISSEVIREYSLRHVDTLHKKNLFSLGEDRYLTTLMSKFFPKLRTKFVADAKCLTKVPDDFSVLLSQRRRWINSTVHNLVELLYLPTMCGFCLLSMRAVVFIDLVGTLMLPSVVVYLVYLIYVIASKTSPLPLISIVLICSVYGMQALVFILHRRWQHIFWMIVYIVAYPFHSFILPIYSFWNMDNFGWGNTRVVIDESKGRKVVLQDEDDIYDPKSVPFESWQSYAARKGYPGRERAIIFDNRKGRIVREVYEDPIHYGNWAASQYDEPPISSVHNLHDESLEPTRYSRPVSLNTVADLTVGGDGYFDAGTQVQIRDTIKRVLAEADLETTTAKQLRAKVADLLGAEFKGAAADAVDDLIDEELENMDM